MSIRGSMPKILVRVLMKIGRNRVSRACSTAWWRLVPSRSALRVWCTSRMALFTTSPSRITKPITDLTKAGKTIADGDLTADVPVINTKDEVEELREALKENDTKAIENEFADVLAWLASLANILNIDLEKAALSKYANKCPKCGLSPCDCPF